MQRRLPIWDEAPKRAIDAVTTVLQQAQLRREIEINDPSAAARQFVAMLRGDLHLEILFGLRGCPGATETNIRVKSAVDLLLCGARATGRSHVSFSHIQTAVDDWVRTVDLRRHCRSRGPLHTG